MHDRFEDALRKAADRLTNGECPDRLADAIRYTLFPPGHRFRPQLCYAVANANGDRARWITDAAAVSLELVHSASLVQDDLPAFDNGSMRRGKTTVHKRFGEPTAILAADALIIGAFQHIAEAVTSSPYTAVELTVTLSRAAGTPGGAVAGQAWESESSVLLDRYHLQKTAALFEASTMMGAIAAGADPEPWRELGRIVGLAYQLADDLHDAGEDGAGDDAAVARPNAVTELGAIEAREMLRARLSDALDAVPSCENPDSLRTFLQKVSSSFGSESEPDVRLVSSAGGAL